MFFVNVSTKALDLRESPSETSEILDILHVGGVVEASHKFLHQGCVWIKIISCTAQCYLKDEGIISETSDGVCSLVQVPGPNISSSSMSKSEASALARPPFVGSSNYWPLKLRGASPWSCLYIVSESVQVYAKPSMSSMNLKQLNPHRVIEISQHFYDAVTKTMWGRIVNGDDTTEPKDEISSLLLPSSSTTDEAGSIEKDSSEKLKEFSSLTPDQERWVILSEVTFRKPSGSSNGQECSLKLRVLDIPLGEPCCFRNIYHYGEVPIRSEPHTKASIVEILPAFISVQGFESKLTPQGELWVHISPQFKPFKQGWIIVMASVDGSVILDPFSLDRYRTASDVNHPKYKQYYAKQAIQTSSTLGGEVENNSVSNGLNKSIYHQWLIEAYDDDGSDVLYFRNILRKAALPFREDPSLTSPVVARLPLGGCLQSAGERLLTKEGQVWARCMLQLGDNNHEDNAGNSAERGDTEAVWAVERNAKDGTTILEKIRSTFKANSEKNNIKTLQQNFKKRFKGSTKTKHQSNSNQHHASSNGKNQNSHHNYGIVYIVRHNGDLPVLSRPGYGEQGCKELGSLSNGSIFIAQERRLNTTRSPPSMWIQLKECDEETLHKYHSQLSAWSSGGGISSIYGPSSLSMGNLTVSSAVTNSMHAAMQTGQMAAMQSGNLAMKMMPNPFTMTAKATTANSSSNNQNPRERYQWSEGSGSNQVSSGESREASSVCVETPPESMSCMYEGMKYGGGWVPESLGGISCSVEELKFVIPFHLDTDKHFLSDNEYMTSLLHDDVSSNQNSESDDKYGGLSINPQLGEMNNESDEDNFDENDDEDMIVYVDSPENKFGDFHSSSSAFPEISPSTYYSSHDASSLASHKGSSISDSQETDDLDWLNLPSKDVRNGNNNRSSKAGLPNHNAIDTIKEMKKMRMKLEEEARREQALIRAEEERKLEELNREKKLKELKRKEEIQRIKDEEAARIRALKEAEEEKKRLEGEAELRDLLDALDSFTEEDTKRAQDRRTRDADNWSSAKEGNSDFTSRTPPPIVSPRGNYYLGALTVKLRRPPKPPGSSSGASSSSQPQLNKSISFFDDSDEELDLSELDDDGIRLYYTTDGSDPDPRFSLSDPLEIDVGPGVTHIKVIACGRDMQPSKVVHARYVVYGDGYGKCCMVDLAIRCHHCVFKSGFVQKLRSRLFWPRRRNTRRSNYAPLSGQSNHSTGGGASSSYHGNNGMGGNVLEFEDNDDEFNTIKEHQPKRRSMLPSMSRFGFKRRSSKQKGAAIGGGGLDARYRQQGRSGASGSLSKFLDAIGMSTPKDTARHGYANVEFEGEF